MKTVRGDALPTHHDTPAAGPAAPPAAALQSITAAWRALERADAAPTERVEWSAAWLQAGATRPSAARFLRVHRGDRLVAVAPTVVAPVRGVPRLQLLGLTHHFEPMDLVAADDAAMRSLAGLIARQNRPVQLARLPADSPAIAALRDAHRGRAIIRVAEKEACPYILLDATWTEPEQRLSSRRRSDLRRAQRRLDALGEATSAITAPDPADLDALLDEAFLVEERSWKRAAGSALSRDRAAGEFFRRYAHLLAERGALRLGFLRVDGRPIAMQFAVRQGDGYWLLKTSYDEEFSRCSPGLLLLRDSLAHAAADGARTFEFMGITESWIAAWTRAERRTCSLHTYPVTRPAGVAALAVDAAALVARRSGRIARRAADGVRRRAARARGAVGAASLVAARLAAARYVAGDDVAAAEAAAARHAPHPVTYGYWDGPDDTPADVEREYRAAIDALGARGDGAYLSLKLPALGFEADRLAAVAAHAQARGVRIHFDAMAPDTADRTRAAIEELIAAVPGSDPGYTIPGRWLRSAGDAEWASARGLVVRVVKGQWEDPAAPDRDLRTGYLEVIEALAGRAARVSVATHDAPLAAAAIARLRAAGTPCDLELLHGLPMRASLRQAADMGVDVRVYVPYGAAYLPYALRRAGASPRTVLWLARDLAASAAARVRRRT